jgi:hypothetical protein
MCCQTYATLLEQPRVHSKQKTGRTGCKHRPNRNHGPPSLNHSGEPPARKGSTQECSQQPTQPFRAVRHISTHAREQRPAHTV